MEEITVKEGRHGVANNHLWLNRTRSKQDIINEMKVYLKDKIEHVSRTRKSRSFDLVKKMTKQ